MKSEAILQTLVLIEATRLRPSEFRARRINANKEPAFPGACANAPAGDLRQYDLLAHRTPNIGALVARAAAYGEVRGADAGLALLDQIDLASVQTYQPFWATRAHWLQGAGRDAGEAFDRAIGLARDPAIRDYLWDKMTGGGA